MTLINENAPSYLPVEFLTAPGNVRAYTTLISGGISTGHYSEFNLATHVGDELSAVNRNREKLVRDLALPAEPIWLDQVHSNHVIYVDENSSSNAVGLSGLKADASVTRTKDVVCAVLTADCLPVFICNQSGTEVAVVHAGWRGLHTGIISNTLNAMKSSTDELLVNLGPAIGPKVFEVGVEVMQAFVDKDDLNTEAFVVTRKNHYLCDIYQLARNELSAIGVTQVSGGDSCTYSESERFYSFRRQKITGRMASVIWLG